MRELAASGEKAAANEPAPHLDSSWTLFVLFCFTYGLLLLNRGRVHPASPTRRFHHHHHHHHDSTTTTTTNHHHQPPPPLSYPATTATTTTTTTTTTTITTTITAHRHRRRCRRRTQRQGTRTSLPQAPGSALRDLSQLVIALMRLRPGALVPPHPLPCF